MYPTAVSKYNQAVYLDTYLKNNCATIEWMVGLISLVVNIKKAEKVHNYPVKCKSICQI